MTKQSTPPLGITSASRRRFVQQSATTLCFGALSPTVWAAGSDVPELKEVRIGFIPLTDCASLVMASVLGLDQKHGVKFVLSKEASWAAVRDKLVSGELDAAHVLYGLVYGVHLGLGGTQKDMAVLMTLNQNGQAITLSQQLADKGVTDGATLSKLMAREKREYTFAHTFPTGTHAMWLYYWMAAHGIDPMKSAKVITVPPPQMVANMRVGNMDGYCVGEPWNHRAIVDKIGITVTTTQDIWQGHPEKVLGCSAEFAQKNPNTARAMIMATLEASRWIETNLANKQKMAKTIAERAYVNTSVDVISERIMGRYQNGLGKTWDDPHHMKFYGDGAVNFPYTSDGMWFMTQHRRWGLLKKDIDYVAIAKKINQTELYKQAAAGVKVNVPKEDTRSAKLMDGQVWDGKNAAQYAASFKIKALA